MLFIGIVTRFGLVLLPVDLALLLQAVERTGAHIAGQHDFRPRTRPIQRVVADHRRPIDRLVAQIRILFGQMLPIPKDRELVVASCRIRIDGDDRPLIGRLKSFNQRILIRF